MPYIVQELIEDNPTLVTASPDEPAQSALARMIEHDFSQLPIVIDENKPVGMITSESILRALNNFGVGLDRLRVEHARVKADEFRSDADLFELLNRLRDTYAVLIVDGERHLLGIVTYYDAAEYFRRRAEDMMHVEDIETTLKDYIQAAYTAGEDEIDEEKLDEAVQRITDSGQAQREKFERALIHYLTLQGEGGKVKLNQEWLDQVFRNHFDDKRPLRKFADLTLYEYTELLLDKNRWPRYRVVFNLDADAVRTLLDKVRDTRNALAHFRGEISSAQRDHLRFCANWLAQYQDAIANLFAPRMVAQTAVVREQQVTYDVDTSPGGDDIPVITPLEDEADPRESRYAPLAIWLQNQPPEKNQLALSFSEIKEIIDGPLPETAYRHRAWWANDSMNHPQSQQWLEVGWRVASVNMNDQTVRFARIQERQKAYIEFYGALINDLRKMPSFDRIQVLPDGTSWHWIKSVSANGKGLASFNYSFGRGQIFRVELYIDSGNRELNKQLFDGLLAQKDDIEGKLGQELTWQRLDKRRASRVALIFNGSITDSEEELAKLRQKAAPAMEQLVQIMEPRVEAVAQEVLS